MYLKAILSAAFLVLFLLAGESADAASFDCSKASKPDEIAICKTPQLSDLDVKMATLYSVRMEIPMMMGASGNARDEQHEFLKTRAACGSDTSCIASAYNTRVGKLEQTIHAAMQDYCDKIGLCG